MDNIISAVRKYYDEKLSVYGPTPRGVDWNSFESQNMRFEQLLKICGDDKGISIVDYGCGYGALIKYLRYKNYKFHYQGFDVSPAMIEKAKELNTGYDNCNFYSDKTLIKTADYSIASGIFNVKLNMESNQWEEYMLATLGEMCKLGKKGFAFNSLTKYSDPEYMRTDLHYADPLFLFDYCKENFSKYVSLLHDYPLYEFTILVRKQ